MSDIGIRVFGNQLATAIRALPAIEWPRLSPALVLLPWVVPYEALSVNILMFGLYAVGFNLVYGYTGLLSFGHAAFFGVGAYACGIAVATFDVNWLLAIALGTIVGRLRGAMIMAWTGDSDPRHLFRHGDAGAVSVRLLHFYQWTD